jgi:nicotinic acid mononucleotide adenylyltransferase
MAMTAFHRGLHSIRSRKANTAGLDSGTFRTRTIDVSHDIDETRLFAEKKVKPMTEDDLDDYMDLIGVGCTASLVTNKQKRGEYRVHVALQTLRRTVIFSLQLTKDVRSRWEEERFVADLILNAIETTRYESFGRSAPQLPLQESVLANPSDNHLEVPLCQTFGADSTNQLPLRETLPLALKSGEIIQGRQTIGSPPLVELFFGNIRAVLWKNGAIQHFIQRKDSSSSQQAAFNSQAEFTQAIFPGSFNPIHDGHLEMIGIAEKRLCNRVALEISIQNVDKPPLDYIELEYRLKEIEKARPDQAVWLTQTPLFEDKSDIFYGTTFVVGADTLQRFADLRFYHESTHQLHDVLRMIAYHQCRFLVFARQGQNGIESVDTLNIPDMLRSLCDDIPASTFAMNISSSDLRRNEF